MTVERLQAAVTRALVQPKITTSDVSEFQAAVADDGEVTAEELAALKAVCAQYSDRFEPAAASQLSGLLDSLAVAPAPAQPPGPPPPSPSVVSWDSFSVASSRAEVTGSQADAGLQTFDALSGAVQLQVLAPADQLLLASAVARMGVMGEAQALRAVDLISHASPSDAAAFNALAGAAASPLERAYLFKALGAGHTLPELSAFAATIHGWDNTRLLETLNLADPNLDDGAQSGIKQQFHASCVPTTSQALRGELDPIYALAVRSQNSDIHQADEADAFKLNADLAGEQKAILEGAGGVAEPRSGGGSGTPWGQLDAVYNAHAEQTGFVFTNVQLDSRPDFTLATALDAIAVQLQQGIPTPLLVGVSWSPKCHAMLALDVQGTGADQRFLIHDPWGGDTMWVSRAAFLAGNAQMGEFQVLGGFDQAAVAPLAVVPPSPAVVPGPIS